MQAFFTQRLIAQRHASPHTIAAYRDALRLLLEFASKRLQRPPCQLDIGDLDSTLIAAFLDHLEHERGNSVSTRNARLAAIHSLFHFAALRHPEHAHDIERVLAIPTKRTHRALVTFLDENEVDALLTAPDRTTWTGRRDHTLLVLAIQTGLRADELIALDITEVHLATGPHVSCTGKGRKQRITPLTATTAAVLRAWLDERAGQPDDPLFPTIRGRRLSHDALERRLAKYTAIAAQHKATLAAKNVTMHTLRHTAAMQLLHADVDITVIALWLGHERTDTTQIYLHADLALKERALSRTKPADVKPGRYRPTDALLAFLEAL
jgi:integrase/recombinase XerD